MNLIHFSFRVNTTDGLLKIVAMSNVVSNMIRFMKLLDSIKFYALWLRTKTLNYFQNLIGISAEQEVLVQCDLRALVFQKNSNCHTNVCL